MTMRITTANLEARVKRLNELTGSPVTSYTKHDGKITANIGNYHLDGAYGGVKLNRMVNEGGGIEDISRTGFVSKRELYIWINAFIAGIELARENE